MAILLEHLENCSKDTSDNCLRMYFFPYVPNSLEFSPYFLFLGILTEFIVYFLTLVVTKLQSEMI